MHETFLLILATLAIFLFGVICGWYFYRSISINVKDTFEEAMNEFKKRET